MLEPTFAPHLEDGEADRLHQNPILHFSGRSTFPSPYRVKPEVLRESYDNVAPEELGSTRVLLAPTRSFRVCDVQYGLGAGKVGLYLLPVNDDDPVSGSQVVDDFLRREMRIGPADPVYALIAYATIRMQKGTIPDLLTDGYRSQMAFTHMGAYLGKGRTSNAPENYHGRKWGVSGYPANVLVVSLTGVDQAVLNRNAHLADACLNWKVKFPIRDYTNAMYRPIDLNTTLMFYRDWIRGERYLRDDDTWATYCSAHKTIVTNVFLNVPHNEAAFAEIFGADGRSLFTAFKQRFKEINGRDFSPADETRFTPLWKQLGLTPQQIRPFTKSEYDVYNEARMTGNLDHYHGFRPLSEAQALAWAPLTNADLIHAVMQAYFDFPNVGAVVASGTIYALMDMCILRMGITKEQYLGHAMRVFNNLMVADAKVNAHSDPTGYLRKAHYALYLAFGGTPRTDLSFSWTPENTRIFESYLDESFTDVPDPNVLATEALKKTVDLYPEILQEGPVSVQAAYEWFLIAALAALQAARQQLVGGPNKVEFYVPPVIAHLCGIGLIPTSPLVTLREVCTAMDHRELSLSTTRSLPMPTKPSQDVIRLADTILYDLRGPGYYRDPEILSGLIRHRLGSRVSEPQARQIAEAVNAAFQERADLDQSALEGLLVEQGLA